MYKISKNTPIKWELKERTSKVHEVFFHFRETKARKGHARRDKIILIKSGKDKISKQIMGTFDKMFMIFVII